MECKVPLIYSLSVKVATSLVSMPIFCSSELRGHKWVHFAHRP